ncbi:MAG: O-antigen ligase family protein [Clostridia bacterium]|nr:O-antigen ligase family protein [Clostridia bacterium]
MTKDSNLIEDNSSNRFYDFLEKFYSTIQTSVFLLLITMIWVNPLIFKSNVYKYTVSMGVLLSLVSIAINLLHGRSFFNYKKYRLEYLIAILTIGISFLFNAFYHNIILSYIIIAFTFLIIIPLWHLSMTYESIDFYFLPLAKGILYSYVIFILTSVISGPMLTLRHYSAVTINPNIAGAFSIIVTSASIYLLFFNIKNGKSFCKFFIPMSLSIALCLFTQSRTSLISVIAQIIFAFIVAIPYFSKNFENKKVYFKKFVGVIVSLLVSFIIAISLLFVLLTFVKEEIIQIAPQIQIEIDTSEKISDVSNAIDNIEGTLKKGIDTKDGDSFTSGRLGIWNDFLKNIKLTGHAKEGRDIIVKNRVYKGTNSHNVYIQVAYSAGVFAGIAMLLLMIFIIIKSFICFFNIFKKQDVSPGMIFSICSAIGFFFFSITSGGYMMFTYFPSTLFWILMAGFSIKKEKQK